MCFSAKYRDQKFLVIETHSLPTSPQLPGDLVSKIYAIFGSGTRLTPNFVFKSKVSLMPVTGGKRHCFTVQILNEAAQSEERS